MAKVLRGFIFWPMLILAVSLAIANRELVQFSFDPFSSENPALAIQMPLFVVLLAGVLIGLVFGGLSAWADQAHWRRAARDYRKKLQALEAQNAGSPPVAQTGSNLPALSRSIR
jgi:uncharacterized integral membrane protein